MTRRKKTTPAEPAEEPRKEPNPFEALTQLWSQSAKVYTEAVQTFFEKATATAQQLGEAAAKGAAVDPAEAMRRYAEQWSEAAAKLSTLQPQLLEGLLKDLPRTAKERLDAQTFSQLDRLAALRWEEEIKRLAEVRVDLGERLGRADPSHLSGLLESMSAEYVRDLQGLGQGSLDLNLEPLAQAWEKVLAGRADEAERATIDRLLKAMVTKARYGSEYYADPEETPVGQSPREALHKVGRATLYRYTPPEGAPARRGAPVLLVYSIINQPYILDLVPGFSFVEHLLGAGLDVYLIDWGGAEPGDRETTLDALIDGTLRACVEQIKARTGAGAVSLFGHCIGGNLALLYASLYPEDVARLVTLTTPVTAAKGGVVAVWTDRHIFPVDQVIDSFGLMPAKLIRYTFMSLKPYYEVLKWKMFMEQLHNEQVMKLFYPVDRWANENVDVPGEVFRKFVVEVFHEDRFRKGLTEINGRRAELRRVACPLFNLAASKDWIVPPESAEPLADAVGSEEKYFTMIEGAHVAIMIDPRAHKHWVEMSDFLLGKPPLPA